MTVSSNKQYPKWSVCARGSVVSFVLVSTVYYGCSSSRLVRCRTRWWCRWRFALRVSQDDGLWPHKMSMKMRWLSGCRQVSRRVDRHIFFCMCYWRSSGLLLVCIYRFCIIVPVGSCSEGCVASCWLMIRRYVWSLDRFLCRGPSGWWGQHRASVWASLRGVTFIRHSRS